MRLVRALHAPGALRASGALVATRLYGCVADFTHHVLYSPKRSRRHTRFPTAGSSQPLWISVSYLTYLADPTDRLSRSYRSMHNTDSGSCAPPRAFNRTAPADMLHCHDSPYCMPHLNVLITSLANISSILPNLFIPRGPRAILIPMYCGWAIPISWSAVARIS